MPPVFRMTTFFLSLIQLSNFDDFFFCCFARDKTNTVCAEINQPFIRYSYARLHSLESLRKYPAMTDVLNKATDTAGGLAKQATDTAGGLTKTATDTAGGLTGDAASNVKGKASGGVSATQQGGGGAQDGTLDGPYGPGQLVGGGKQAKKNYRMVPVKQSRIADRPPKPNEKDSAIRIKIELDLEVEVEIYARVKGDVTIGLM
ncbi:hypothetical protein EJ08DRAFT_682368 [Tothia fuscella]|uniref:Uncharacterized protein n=1 Tax=Tothia fuscella TaxID=1048955 RepID=A0A9P4NIK1_9PEZI|nr:hypothetical protein EJ08DRAFT_682368 [Tothia fuscella]